MHKNFAKSKISKIKDLPGFQNWINPCKSNDANGIFTDFNITGRESGLRMISGNMKSRLNTLKLANFCDFETMPYSLSKAGFQNIFNLTQAYRTALLLAAHFEVLTQDFEYACRDYSSKFGYWSFEAYLHFLRM